MASAYAGRTSPAALCKLQLVFGLGVTGAGIAFILCHFIIQQLGAVRAAGVTYIPPVVAMLIGSMLAHEPVLAESLVAMVLIMGGVYVLQSGKKQGQAAPRP